MFSFLPKCQRNGRDLARQCQAGQLRFDSLGQQTFIKILEWSRAKSSAQGRTLEDLLHRVVVILIESANLLWLLPQLPLAPEPVRGLHKGYQLRGPKRADKGNLTQDFHGLMFSALG